MNKVYGVVFNDGGKVYYFKTDIEYLIGKHVIVNTEKGEQYGKITVEVNDLEKIKNIDKYKDILREATKDDYNKNLQNLKDAMKAVDKCKKISQDLNLNMKIINASFTFDRSQLMFNFLADERVDFRELAKKLASIYKTRIELRQVGARDKAREIAGIGICGQKLCCANFLNNIDSVSINMAKNQNMALNPTKINGQCNRLLCCLSYEDDLYSDNRKKLPTIGSKLKIDNKDGVVVDLDVLNNRYILEVDNERIVVDNDNSKK